MKTVTLYLCLIVAACQPAGPEPEPELWCGAAGCFTQAEMEAGYRADAEEARTGQGPAS